MSLDPRLREGLQRAMSSIEADADERLTEARSRARRRRIARRMVGGLALVAALIILVVIAPAILDAVGGRHPQPAIEPATLPLEGTYLTTITTEDADSIGLPEIAGGWLLILRGDGVQSLASLDNASFGRATTQYQVVGRQIVTAALTGKGCAGVGRYIWSRSGSTLTLDVVNDPCALRVGVLSSRAWSVG
jgi:hypothetical protein